MHSSVRAMLAGIVDYAGLFPPAGLPMDQAIRQFTQYRKEPESWMLNRFICSADRLTELGPFLEELIRSDDPISVSVLCQGIDNLPSSKESIAAFRNQHGRHALVDMFEFRQPPDYHRDRQEARRHFDILTGLMFQPEEVASLTLFFESKLGGDWRETVADLIKSFAGVPSSGEADKLSHRPREGYKLRCGGLEAKAFPTPEQVAFVIATCRDAGVPLKFTAGLHHAMRHFDTELQTHVHGFLNVFGAGVLAQARQLDEVAIRAVIEDEDLEHFVFEDNRFRWKDHDTTLAEIVAARKYSVLSFGSCSFDEPRADLRQLGLL